MTRAGRVWLLGMLLLFIASLFRYASGESNLTFSLVLLASAAIISSMFLGDFYQTLNGKKPARPKKPL